MPRWFWIAEAVDVLGDDDVEVMQLRFDQPDPTRGPPQLEDMGPLGGHLHRNQREVVLVVGAPGGPAR